MPAPYTDRELDQQDAVATRRAQAEDWVATKPTKVSEVSKVEAALAAHLADPYHLLAMRREDEYEATPVALPYVGWITPAGGTPQRIDIKPVTSREKALEKAQAIARSLFGDRPFHSMVRPA